MTPNTIQHVFHAYSYLFRSKKPWSSKVYSLGSDFIFYKLKK